MLHGRNEDIDWIDHVVSTMEAMMIMMQQIEMQSRGAICTLYFHKLVIHVIIVTICNIDHDWTYMYYPAQQQHDSYTYQHDLIFTFMIYSRHHHDRIYTPMFVIDAIYTLAP